MKEEQTTRMGIDYWRRRYNHFVSRSFLFAVLFSVALYSIPYFIAWMTSQKEVALKDVHARVVSYSELSAPPPIELQEPSTPLEQNKIQMETVKFLQPVIKPDDEVPDEELLPTVDQLKHINPGVVSSEGIDSVYVSGEVVEVVEEVQEEVEEEDFIFMIAERQPEFPGGVSALYKFLGEHLIYPDLAREMRISGTVVVQFVVERDGSISDISVARSVGGGLDEEAVRVISKMPKWNPGEQGNRKVRVRYAIPVRFTLLD
jgi:protein TonB